MAHWLPILVSGTKMANCPAVCLRRDVDATAEQFTKYE
jgi:hypothetical protein